MPEIPVPPGFRQAVAERRRRRRARYVALAVLGGVLFTLIAGAVVWQRRDAGSTTADQQQLAESADATSQPSSDAATTECPAGESDTELVVASSPDKAALLTRLSEQYNADDKNSDCITITISPIPSGTAAQALAAPSWPAEAGPRPDVWAPASSSAIALASAARQQTGLAPLVGPESDVPSLATSATVIAMPRPMAAALGWPDKPVGWQSLRDLGLSPTGWGALDHPDWGPFRIAVPSPAVSSNGLNALVAQSTAAVGGPDRLTQASLTSKQTVAAVGAIQQMSVDIRDSTAILADWAQADDKGQGLSYLSALVTDEAQVAAYNEGYATNDLARSTGAKAPSVELQAIYPASGTVLNDHPYAVLEAEWVDDAKRDAAQAFQAYLLSGDGQAAFARAHYRDAKGVLAADGAKALGLDADQPATVVPLPDVTLLLSAATQWQAASTPPNILNLIDVSSSMRNRIAGSSQSKLSAAEEAAVSSLSLYNQRTAIGLWSFSGGKNRPDYRELVPIGPMDGAIGDGTRRQAMIAAIEGLEAGGKTHLYDTISDARRYMIDYAQKSSSEGSPAAPSLIVVITDGQNDNDGGMKLSELLAELRSGPADQRIKVMTIAYGPDADSGVLRRIAQASGGAAFDAPRPEDLPRVYAQAIASI